MDLGIAGKIALVAAASKGFGRAIATQLAAEGCRVAICARTRETLEQTANEIAELVKPTNPTPEIMPIVADVADENACRVFVQAARRQMGLGRYSRDQYRRPHAGHFRHYGRRRPGSPLSKTR